MTDSTTESEPTEFVTNDVVVNRKSMQVSMRDGALISAYIYERAPSSGPKRKHTPSPVPLLCLPTELGNSREYHQFILEFISHNNAPKRVYALDMRGRGRSTGKGVAESSVVTDAEDLISFCDAVNLHHFDLLVSGRTAPAVYLTTPQRPTLIRCLILVDGGTTFDSVGTARQTALRQRQSPPANWEEAVSNLRELKEKEFPALSDDDWDAMARMSWRDEDGKPIPDIQEDLVRSGNSANYDAKQLDLSREVKLMALRPTLLVRGENSTQVTTEISDKMQKRQPNLKLITAKGQGHVPLLYLDGLPKSILDFVTGD